MTATERFNISQEETEKTEAEAESSLMNADRADKTGIKIELDANCANCRE